MAERDRGFREAVTGAPVTFVDRVRPDGVIVRWESRRHRKHLHDVPAGSTWWAPGARGWWIAVLFAVGSLLFAAGAVPAYASAVGTRWDNVTFFIGSLFFTTAAFLTYREAVDAAPAGQNPAHRRFLVYQPRRIDWWATGVQLIGTLFFNVSTGTATVDGLSAQAAHQHVWRPDAVGSVCFLVSSALAWYEVCHGWAAWRPVSWSWWITLANLVGSVAFGVSAVAAYVNPVTGEVRDAGRAERWHPDRRGVFLRGRRAAAARTHRGSRRPGTRARRRRRRRPARRRGAVNTGAGRAPTRFGRLDTREDLIVSTLSRGIEEDR